MITEVPELSTFWRATKDMTHWEPVHNICSNLQAALILFVNKDKELGGHKKLPYASLLIEKGNKSTVYERRSIYVWWCLSIFQRHSTYGPIFFLGSLEFSSGLRTKMHFLGFPKFVHQVWLFFRAFWPRFSLHGARDLILAPWWLLQGVERVEVLFQINPFLFPCYL